MPAIVSCSQSLQCPKHVVLTLHLRYSVYVR
jgi:hypothetical protein